MSDKSDLPRGIRNCNPGNLDRTSAKWQGLVMEHEITDSRFCQFIDPTWGIRAMAVTLITYQDKHGINTIRGIIGRWAPPVENDTGAYVKSVCKAAGIGPDERLDIHRYAAMQPIVEAIIRHENGAGPLSTVNSWYDRATIDTGLQRAGVVDQAATVGAMPITKETVAATGTGALGAAQIAEVAPQIVTAIDSQQDHLSSGSIVRIVLGVLTIGLAVFIAYSQVKKHQNGVVA